MQQGLFETIIRTARWHLSLVDLPPYPPLAFGGRLAPLVIIALNPGHQMPVNEEHRPYLEILHMLALDHEGREILVGLTFEETEWLFDYVERRITGGPRNCETDAERERYFELNDRIDAARLRCLSSVQ